MVLPQIKVGIIKKYQKSQNTKIARGKSNKKTMTRNCTDQKPNPVLDTNMGNNSNHDCSMTFCFSFEVLIKSNPIQSNIKEGGYSIKITKEAILKTVL